MGEMSGEDLRTRLAALVDDARAAGLGWDELAAALGSAADDARVRAGADAPEAPGPTPAGVVGQAPPGVVGQALGPDPGAARAEHAPERTAKIGPVTMFTEMDALERAGRHGWTVVGSGSAMHVVAHTGEQWEYRRVFASRATGRALEADGWRRFSSGWFPWGYYQRPTGRPPEAEQAVGGFLLEP